MILRTSILALLFVLLSTTSAFALWLDDSCTEIQFDFAAMETADCMSVADNEGIDAAFNLCLEIAGFPISTLPSLIEDSESLTLEEAVIAELNEDIMVSFAPVPDVRLKSSLTFDHLPKPKPVKNECSSFTDECERQPFYPTYQLEEVSSPSATDPSEDQEIDVLPDVERKSKSPAYLKRALSGFAEELEEPPQVG